MGLKNNRLSVLIMKPVFWFTDDSALTAVRLQCNVKHDGYNHIIEMIGPSCPIIMPQ